MAKKEIDKINKLLKESGVTLKISGSGKLTEQDKDLLYKVDHYTRRLREKYEALSEDVPEPEEQVVQKKDSRTRTRSRAKDNDYGTKSKQKQSLKNKVDAVTEDEPEKEPSPARRTTRSMAKKGHTASETNLQLSRSKKKTTTKRRSSSQPETVRKTRRTDRIDFPDTIDEQKELESISKRRALKAILGNDDNQRESARNTRRTRSQSIDEKLLAGDNVTDDDRTTKKRTRSTSRSASAASRDGRRQHIVDLTVIEEVPTANEKTIIEEKQKDVDDKEMNERNRKEEKRKEKDRREEKRKYEDEEEEEQRDKARHATNDDTLEDNTPVATEQQNDGEGSDDNPNDQSVTDKTLPYVCGVSADPGNSAGDDHEIVTTNRVLDFAIPVANVLDQTQGQRVSVNEEAPDNVVQRHDLVKDDKRKSTRNSTRSGSIATEERQKLKSEKVSASTDKSSAAHPATEVISFKPLVDYESDEETTIVRPVIQEKKAIEKDRKTFVPDDNSNSVLVPKEDEKRPSRKPSLDTESDPEQLKAIMLPVIQLTRSSNEKDRKKFEPDDYFQKSAVSENKKRPAEANQGECAPETQSKRSKRATSIANLATNRDEISMEIDDNSNSNNQKGEEDAARRRRNESASPEPRMDKSHVSCRDTPPRVTTNSRSLIHDAYLRTRSLDAKHPRLSASKEQLFKHVTVTRGTPKVDLDLENGPASHFVSELPSPIARGSMGFGRTMKNLLAEEDIVATERPKPILRRQSLAAPFFPQNGSSVMKRKSVFMTTAAPTKEADKQKRRVTIMLPNESHAVFTRTPSNSTFNRTRSLNVTHNTTTLSAAENLDETDPFNDAMLASRRSGRLTIVPQTDRPTRNSISMIEERSVENTNTTFAPQDMTQSCSPDGAAVRNNEENNTNRNRASFIGISPVKTNVNMNKRPRSSCFIDGNDFLKRLNPPSEAASPVTAHQRNYMMRQLEELLDGTSPLRKRRTIDRATLDPDYLVNVLQNLRANDLSPRRDMYADVDDDEEDEDTKTDRRPLEMSISPSNSEEIAEDDANCGTLNETYTVEDAAKPQRMQDLSGNEDRGLPGTVRDYTNDDMSDV